MSTTTTRPPKPKALPVHADGIPAELKALDQWVVWRYTWKDGKNGKPGKWDKPPYQINGSLADSTDPRTWASFNEAYGEYCLSAGAWDGVGFVIANGYVGVDLDGALDPRTGTYKSWPDALRRKFKKPVGVADPADILKDLGTYAEISPSNTGAKAIGRGSLPGGQGKPRNRIGNKAAGLEFYDCDRFFCITGHLAPDCPPAVGELNENLRSLHEAVFGQPSGNGKASRKSEPSESASAEDGKRPSDEEVLDAIFGSQNGEKVQKLLDGDISDYSSPSEADSALAFHLAFWSRDPGQITRIMRGCKLCRDKYDREDYLQRTIQRALDQVTKFYDWDRPSRVVTNTITIQDQNGEDKQVPLSMAEILARTAQQTEDWPRRVGKVLFVHDPDHGVGWLETPAALFGYYHHRVGRVRWHSGTGVVGRAEMFAELQRTGTRYLAVEEVPHEPMLEDHYYACDPIQPGDGLALQQLLDRFAPASEIDRDLILAALATPLWGGPPGCRPCFTITSDDGRGVGKSTMASLIGEVYGGILSFSHLEEIGKIKTRLLSPEALTRRVCLLDNLKTLKFSWADLEAMITATTIGGHRMYQGEGTRPNTLVWFVTLNGAALSTDMAQRSVIIKLVRPQRSATWEESTRLFAQQNRTAILADLIAFLRSDPYPLAKFSRWATWEREILQRLPEPGEAQRVILERQGEADVEEEEIDILEDYFSGQLRHFGYDTERGRVFIPTRVAARWYSWATNQPTITSGGAGRIIAQLIKEGRSKRLSVNACRTWGRGFIWAGEVVTPSTPTAIDLASRMGGEASGK